MEIRRLRLLARLVAVALGLSLLAAGAFGLLSAYQGDGDLTLQILYALQQATRDSAPGLANRAQDLLASMALRFVVAPAGLVLVGIGCMPWGGGSEERETASSAKGAGASDGGALAVDKRLVKRTEKQAAALRKKGQVQDAAEMLFSVGLMDAAAEYFIEAGAFARAAEIRHDQNRFLESAQLYERGEKFEAAGVIYAQQEKWAEAAQCYLKADGKSVAAEMFEKAGDWKRAAKYYREVEFLRHAAQCYVKCQAWRDAADCLEQIYRDEGAKTHGDPRKVAELNKLVRQAGALYERAGDVPKALDILARGECWTESAQIALRLKEYSRAADLFLEANQPEEAAKALRELGEDAAAARILGEHLRDRGDLKGAAEHLEQAAEWLAAGDLYRQIEVFDRAGHCYVQQQEFAQAAEMYRLSGDRRQAGECYERAGRYTEAAECFALAGLSDREADLLEKAGDFLGSGEAYHREGRDDDAIRVLQQVPAGSPGFSQAASLLGDIFRARGQLSLAVVKLQQALGDAPLTRDNMGVYYALATIHEEGGEARSALDIYEKILALDYHFRDVEARAVRMRDAARGAAVEPAVSEAGSSTGFSQTRAPGRYQIVGELGRGGMGIVYKAKDTVLDRLVAYKVLPDALKENPQALKNFLREAKAAAKLNHPGIVTVYDAGEQDGRYFIAMEFVDGTTLKEILRRRGAVAPAGVLHVLVQVCDALSYAHEHHVVHRDIKTANTMWTRDKKAKLMDFGLAKVVEEVRNHTTVVSGTPYYMSPEQTLGKNVDHRTDIYSLGVTTFEMATGVVPFREGNIPYHHVHTPPPDIRDVRPELPESLAKIVATCLQKSPDKRYQNAREMAAEARAALAKVTA